MDSGTTTEKGNVAPYVVILPPIPGARAATYGRGGETVPVRLRLTTRTDTEGQKLLALLQRTVRPNALQATGKLGGYTATAARVTLVLAFPDPETREPQTVVDVAVTVRSPARV